MEEPCVCLVTPVFNDWEALGQLLSDLDTTFETAGIVLDVVVINDGSTSGAPAKLEGPRKIVRDVRIINLRANVGHQLAIAAGLNYAYRHKKFDAALIMDSDGEDRPSDAIKLVQAWRANPDHLIVAERAKRSESTAFKLFYFFYRTIFRLLTGQSISFGNFSLIPAALLPAVLNRPELMHHIAATLLRAKLPVGRVPTKRGVRYAGNSQMNMPALVLHAVGALSVFSDVLFSRILIASAALGVLCGAGSAFVAFLRLFTDLAFPNWATTVISFLALLAAQAVVLILCTGFLLLTNRATMLLTALETSRLIQETYE